MTDAPLKSATHLHRWKALDGMRALVRQADGRLALLVERDGAVKGVTEQPEGDLTAICQRILNGDETAMTKDAITALAMDRVAAEIEGQA